MVPGDRIARRVHTGSAFLWPLNCVESLDSLRCVIAAFDPRLQEPRRICGMGIDRGHVGMRQIKTVGKGKWCSQQMIVAQWPVSEQTPPFVEES